MQRNEELIKLVKPKFEKQYRAILGDDYDSFIDYSLRFLRRAIRVNTLKISVEDLKKRIEADWDLVPVPWCKEGFWIEHKGEEKRRDVGNLIEHSLGYIYIQEPASMIPPVILDPQPGETILDMCASPGSKSTQIAQYMNNQGVLVCNDYKGLRVKALGLNIQRMGVSHALITLMEGRYFGKSGIEFDKILVDAPCSGIGTIRKSLKTLTIWNPNVIKRIAGTQRQLIQTAFDILKPGGVLVYSTCTLEPDEDEAVIDYLLKNNPSAEVLDVDIPIKRGKPVLEFNGAKYDPSVSKALRIWPQDNDTEGFFVCKVRKNKD
ncbi:NOL1/NOP2/sun family putative RNA methylase [Candidatus Woesearchaeota archaeon]|nr:NOL1/NOP2/sun family putative RNA methylase [Candidatus Woesearchaeota archaeon]